MYKYVKNFSNKCLKFFREMIGHCLKCYGKRYTEEGKIGKVF